MSSRQPADFAAAEVQACLARILASEEFCNSPNLSAFLTFVVGRALQGRADTIRAYTVATEVLGRPPSFDPQADPIVRVEATRLRRSLERYYARTGRGDALVISVPRGSYVPVIVRREDAAASAEPPPPVPLDPDVPQRTLPVDAPRRGTPVRSMPLAAGIAACTIVAVSAALLGFVLRSDAGGAAGEAAAGPLLALVGHEAVPPRLKAAAALTALATITVPPFGEGSSGVRSQALLLTDLMRNALARFEDLVVVEAAAEPPASAALAEDAYVLVGRVLKRGDEVRLALRLRHQMTRQIVWSAELAVPPAAEDGDDAGMRLARTVATTIASLSGVVAADPGAAKMRADPATVPAACIASASAALAGGDESAAAAARDCLRQALETHPRFAPAHAFLARLDLEAWRAAPVADPSLLDQALDEARQALRLAPQAARSHQVLSDVLAARGDRAGAESAGARALDLNPYSADMVATAAFRDIEAGRYREGARRLASIDGMVTAESPWRALYAAIAQRAGGTGAPEAGPAQVPDGSSRAALLLADLLSPGRRPGGDEPGRRAAAELARLVPAAADPAAFLARFGLQPEMMSSAAADLRPLLPAAQAVKG